MEFHAGQCWTYRTPNGLEASRIVIGAVVTFSGDRSIVCCTITSLRRKDANGHWETFDVPFVPMAPSALRASVCELVGEASVPKGFAEHLRQWDEDPNGHTAFTVPFEGSLERMIGLQMAQIASRSSAA